MTTNDICRWLVQRIHELRGVALETIDTRERFTRLGLDSLLVTRVLADLSKELGRSLPPTLAWEYSTIESLARYLTDGADSVASMPSSMPERARGASDEAIAIIGMACRFPGAPNIEAFWQLLCEGRDAITEVPKSRWDIDAFYDADPNTPGKMSTRWGGFLDCVDEFDPQFFGISPREAIQMDPQQRLMLELAWESLEDAGIGPHSLKDSRTGVFVGAMWQDYAKIPTDSITSFTSHSATGQDLSIIPARISYSLGLRGPSMAINTACSSSLVAIHSARRSLQLGECDVAIVGGVNLILSPESTVAMSKFGAMAPDGRSKAFDARANGYVRGEGGGMVIMKRLSQALANGDPIHCVLRGSAINNDGASNGLTAPSPQAQVLVLQDAYRDAGIDPRDVQFVETHGTGTLLGDPIEAGALGSVLGAGRPPEKSLIMGAVKTNLGHLEAAAGMAGFIKAALVVEKRAIPPNLHFQAANPHIDFDTLRLRVPVVYEPLPVDAERILAGVSSFGFGGTNCHVVIEGLRASIGESIKPATILPKNDERVARPKVVFVFGGQGSQWLNMGVELLREPAFSACMFRCSEAMRVFLDGDLLNMLVSRDSAWLNDTAWIQPTIFAIQISLAAFLRAQGIKPSAVVGQSMGEVAAAYVAGCLRLEDAVRIVCTRSRIVKRVTGKGAMAVVELPLAKTEAALGAYFDRLSIAVSTSPLSTVIAGAVADVEAFLGELSVQGIDGRMIKVDYASHCAQMDELLPDLELALAGMKPQRGSVPFYSSVTTKRIDGDALDGSYWCRNLRDPVLLAGTLQGLIEEGHRVFLELDPHPLLVRAVEECLRHANVEGVVVCPLHRDEPAKIGFEKVYATLGESVRANRRHRDMVLPLSAHNEAALRDRAQFFGQWLSECDDDVLSDVAYTASTRRGHLEHRLSVVGSTRDDIAAALGAFAAGKTPPSVVTAKAAQSAPKVVFVFPGQGSQWVGMGRQLYRDEPVFRDALVACDEAIRTEAGFSVVEELDKPEETSRLSDIDVVQPVLFAIEVALAALWRSWGVEPAAVVGHSMGEVAAAFVAGALSMIDAAAIICRRSRLLRKVAGQGAMALVELTLPDAEKALVGYEGRLSVAVSNGPRSTIIAGEPAAIDEVLGKLEQAGVFCQRIKVDVASHSPQMDPLLDDVIAALSDISPNELRIPMRSTVTGDLVRGEELVGRYWADNLRRPVLFANVVDQWIADGFTIFLEMSPHPVLLPFVDENLSDKKANGAVLASLRYGRGERQSMLASLGALFVRGVPVAWKAFFPDGGSVVELPTYPWQRERYWIEAPTPKESNTKSFVAANSHGSEHPLLGLPFTSSLHPEARFWQQSLSVAAIPWLAEHRVQGEVVFPGAGYIELALAAGKKTFGEEPLLIENVSFVQMLVLTAEQLRDVQVVLIDDGDRKSFKISSQSEDTLWTLHASGYIQLLEKVAAEKAELPSTIASRLPQAIDVAGFYEGIRARQMFHGPPFQGIVELRTGGHEALGKIRLPDDVRDDEYTFHPALLDACIQVSLAFFGDISKSDTYVPVGIDRLHLYRRPARELWVFATKSVDAETACDLRIVDEDGGLFAAMDGLRLQRIDGQSRSIPDALEGCVYEVAWVAVDVVPEPKWPTNGTWVVFADRGGMAAALSERFVAKGQRCIRVVLGSSCECVAPDEIRLNPSKPEDYRRLFTETFGEDGRCEGVVHLSSLDVTPFEQTTIESLTADLTHASVSATYLAQAIVRHGFRDAPRLFLVTRGAQSVNATDPISVAQAPILGLGKTIAMEHGELRCTRIDLPADAMENEADLLLRELSSKGREDQIALRGQSRYLARLAREKLPDTPDLPAMIRSDRTYLITGGLGGLGLSLAKWLVEQGSRSLVLVGRKGPSDEAVVAIGAMEAIGARVHCGRVDVSREEDVENLFSTIRNEMLPLGGMVHAAMVLDDHTLLEQSEASFQQSFAPKALGAWNLHKYGDGEHLDFFVMYSSITALIGSPGQANYCASNAFLDALCHERIRLGLPAMSIQWGPFADVGAAAGRDDRGKRLAERGMKSLSPAEGLEAFRWLLHRPRPEVGVVHFDLQQWVEFYPSTAGMPFFGNVIKKADVKKKSGTQSGKTLELLESTPATHRLPLLERHLKEQFGTVLRLDSARIDRTVPLKSLGMDSLMSLELRNRLEASLGIKLSATILFTYASVAALGQHLFERLWTSPPIEASRPERMPEVTQVAQENFDTLSDEDLVRMGEDLLA